MVTEEKPNYSNINLSQCHFVHLNSYTDWPEIEPVPPRKDLRLTVHLYYALLVYHSLG